MARTEFAQPLPGSEGAGTITIEVAAKLLMVTPEWVRRLTKDGWIARTERGRYRVVDVVQGSASPQRRERNAPLSGRV
ncbi:MAG: hypothetical protein WAU59_15245 [Rhodoplanes sp.]